MPLTCVNVLVQWHYPKVGHVAESDGND